MEDVRRDDVPGMRYDTIEARVDIDGTLVHYAHRVMSPSYEAPALCWARCVGWRVDPDAPATCLRCLALEFQR